MRDNTPTPLVQELVDTFWEEVALYIEKEFNLGHPSTWQQAQIEKFLELFDEKIPSLTPINYDKLQNPGLSCSTVRRIFIKKNSKGNASNRDLFSWLLGYNSFQDYIIKRNAVTQYTIEKRSFNFENRQIGLVLFILSSIVIVIKWHASRSRPPKKL